MVGKLLAVLRAPALLFYIFARDAQYRSRAGVAVSAAALAAGVVILATQAWVDPRPYNGATLGLGIAAVLAPVFLAALRWPGIVRKIGGVVTVLVVALTAAVLLGAVSLPEFTLKVWQRIAAACVGLLVFLLAVGFWPARRRV